MSFNTMRDKLHLAGEGATIIKTSSGIFTLLPAVAYDRLVAIFGYAIEAFDNNTGAMTAVKVGQTNDDDKFGTPGSTIPNELTPAAACLAPNQGNLAPASFLGILSANQALILTVTAATGDGTGGGAFAAVAIAAIPAV